MPVKQTSINAFLKLSCMGKSAKKRRSIVLAMKKGKSYTRAELEKPTGQRTSSVCGRVFELLEHGLIDALDTKVCSVTGQSVEALRLTKKGLKIQSEIKQQEI